MFKRFNVGHSTTIKHLNTQTSIQSQLSYCWDIFNKKGKGSEYFFTN